MMALSPAQNPPCTSQSSVRPPHYVLLPFPKVNPIPPSSDLTGINANQTYPGGIKHVIKTKLYLATIIMHTLSLGLFFLASLAWYFPSLVVKKDIFEILGNCVVIHFLIGFALFISNWFIHVSGLGTFNSVDNFYAPAPCGTKRSLFPGVLMRVNEGNAYKLVWAAWCMVYLFGTILMLFRVCWIKTDMDAALASRTEKEMKEAAMNTQAAQRKAEDDANISEKNGLHSTFNLSGTVV